MAPLLRALLTASAAAASSAAAVSPPGVALWTAYSGSANCYRQPLLVATPSALLAFVEGRPGIAWCSGTDWPAAPDFPILLRRSADGGATWGAEQQLARGNLDFLVAVFDAVASRVLLLVQQGDDGVVQLASGDDGATWSAPAPVAVAVPQGLNLSALIPGVGHGLQVSAAHCLDPTCAGLAGRLVLPFVATLSGPVSNDTACGTCATALVVSDDGGATWSLGAVSEQNGSREAALAQLDSADFGTLGAVLLASERNLGNATGTRLRAVSADGGASFRAAAYARDGLPDVVTANWTGCVDGMTRFVDPASPSAPPRLAFTAPAAVGERADLSLWVSCTGGASWLGGAPVQQLWAGPSAYSDAIQLNSTHLGVVFEGGAAEFAGGIQFLTVPFPALC